MSTPLPAIDIGPFLLDLGVNYAIHSTLLAVVAGLVLATHRLISRARCLELEEGLWRLALFGALLTIPVQATVGPGEPRFLQFATTLADDVSPSTEMPIDTGLLAVRPDASTYTHPGHEASARVNDSQLAQAKVPLQPGTPEPAMSVLWPSTSQLVGGWLAVSLLLSMRLAVATYRLRRRVERLPPAHHAPAITALARLARHARLAAPPRLLIDDTVASPFAAVCKRPTIVLPRRALDELDNSDLAAVLAHETAHFARRDPFWRAAVLCLSSALWFQPLTWLLGRRLASISEQRSDDWAAGFLGQGFSLARSLATVASWNRGRSSPPAASLALTQSSLRRRICRLLANQPEDPSMSNSHVIKRGLLPCLAGALLAATVFPAFSTQSPPRPPEPAPVVAKAPAAPALAPSSAPEPLVVASPAVVPAAAPAIAVAPSPPAVRPLSAPNPVPGPVVVPRVSPSAQPRVVVGPSPSDQELADLLLDAARQLRHEELTPEERARLLVDLRRSLVDGTSGAPRADVQRRVESLRAAKERAARAQRLQDRELASAEQMARSSRAAQSARAAQARELYERARRHSAGQQARDEQRARAAYDEAVTRMSEQQAGDQEAQIRDLEARMRALEEQLRSLKRVGDV